MSFWRTISKWLENNKIFFETVVGLLLAIMAITLTYVSIDVSEKANEIAFYETEIMKIENQPIFHFEINQNYTNFSNDFVPAMEELTIDNIGKPFREATFDTMIFLKIRCWENRTYPKSALIPISNYYIDGYKRTNLIDKLTFRDHFYIKNTGNLFEIKKAEKNFSDFVRTHNDSVDFDIIRFIRVRYIDIFGDTHEQVYFIDPYYGAHKLTKEEEENINDFYKSFSYYETLKISELSPNILYEKWSMNVNKSEEMLYLHNSYYYRDFKH